MAEKTPQTYANHARFHPPFHYFLAPGAVVLVILGAINVFRRSSESGAWILLFRSAVDSAPLRIRPRTSRAHREGACGGDAGAGNQEKHRGTACR